MADRHLRIRVREITVGSRVGQRVGTTAEYIPDTKKSNVHGVWSAYVIDATMGTALSDLSSEMVTVDSSNP